MIQELNKLSIDELTKVEIDGDKIYLYRAILNSLNQDENAYVKQWNRQWN